MTTGRRLGFAGGLVLLAAAAVTVYAGGFGQQYYGGWNYYPSRGYHYCNYYYRPYVSYPSYSYHYCICYPQYPNYVYYYNPHRQYYWGRYDLQNKGYSLLAEADRKGSVKDIPESAFPAPGKMPAIPAGVDGGKEIAAKGNTLIEPPPAPPVAAGAPGGGAPTPLPGKKG
jgi:hypothetical protein